MPVLQRSCRACVSAKRQCDLTIPRCGRCSARRIACKYVNQPGATGLSLSKVNHRLSDEKLWTLDKSPCSSPSGFGPRLKIYDPLRLEIIHTFDRATVQRQINILQNFLAAYAQHGSNAFIHPRLYEPWIPTTLKDVSVIISASGGSNAEHLPIPMSKFLKLKVRHLLYLGARASSFTELVSYVQTIVLLQISRLFHADPEDDPELDNRPIVALTYRLWQRAPAQLPSSLSPWRAWAFAESVRRTILVCHISLGVYGALRRGYTVYPLCIEALPFDMRTQLWGADTEDSWRAASPHTGCAPPLVSFRQFKSLQQSTANHSPFESLLHLSFKDLG
ncbi:hypothetical protein HD806DRAFT_536865 [Xylariaceae sp. AK1471]|nr:hypothetical protein HD806DRAFT_536865 [Xylariaceae sp. AK1471]